MWGKPREVRTGRHTSRTLFFAGRGIVTGSQGHACSQHLDSKYLCSHCDRVSNLDTVTAVGREHTKPLPALGATSGDKGAASGDKADAYHGRREKMDAGCSEASLPVAEESGAGQRVSGAGGTLYQSVVCLVEEQEEVKIAGLEVGRAGARAKGSRQQPVTLGKDRGTFFKC